MSSTPSSSFAQLCQELPTPQPIQHPKNPAMAKEKPFNFIGLPIELCLMVYERIPCQIHHTRVIPSLKEYEPQPILTLVRRTCSTAILLTSRTVYHEAKKIVGKVANEWITQQPLRLISGRRSALEAVDQIINGVLMSDVQKDWMYQNFVDILDLFDKHAVKKYEQDPDNRVQRLRAYKNTPVIRAGHLQYMQQMLRALVNENEVRLEIVVADPVLNTYNERLERFRIFEELIWCDALQDAMAEGRVTLRVPGLLRHRDAENITAATAESLIPGLDILEDYGSTPTMDGLKVMAQNVWEDGWVATASHGLVACNNDDRRRWA